MHLIYAAVVPPVPPSSPWCSSSPGGVRAFRDKCPHQDNPLSDGLLDGDTLTCAFHLWIFDTMTGESINPTDECLTAHQCRIEGDKIQVKFKSPDD